MTSVGMVVVPSFMKEVTMFKRHSDKHMMMPNAVLGRIMSRFLCCTKHNSKEFPHI
jgi:hypothetical protein